VFEFKLPDLGEGVHEGEILKWYVEVGQSVKEDEPLVDIETDKAAVTIPSPRGGTLVRVAGGVGDTVVVGSVLAAIDESATSAAPPPKAPAAAAAPPSSPKPAQQPAAKPAQATPAATAPARAVDAARPAAPLPKPPAREPVAATATAAAAPARAGGPVPAAPATRRLARELGVDLATVAGTGPGGRVTKDDVRLFAEGGIAVMPGAGNGAGTRVAPSGAGPSVPYYDHEPMPAFEQWGPVDRQPFVSIRRKVAKKMVTSMVTVPHVAHMDDADVTELEIHRVRTKEAGGPSVTLLAFVTRAVTTALRSYPSFNASLDPDRNELVYKQYYNVGFAADTPRGLLVPVVKNADRLSIVAISDEIRRLADLAREGTIGVPDLQGGTFTVTNVGAIGGSYVVPTINYPESAILGMGRVVERPVVRDGAIVPRKILPLCITFDHRISDGADGARFMNAIVRYLSDPLSLLAEM